MFSGTLHHKALIISSVGLCGPCYSVGARLVQAVFGLQLTNVIKPDMTRDI